MDGISLEGYTMSNRGRSLRIGIERKYQPGGLYTTNNVLPFRQMLI